MPRIPKSPFTLSLILFLLIWIDISCKAQSEARTVKTGSTKIFDVSFYPDDNNVAKAAVILNDGFLIAGQKFSKQDGPDMLRSAIIKLNLKGELVKQDFLGNTGYRDAKTSAMIEQIIKIDEQTIFQVGSKSNKLWVRVLNHNLDLLQDTVISAIPVTGITPPKVGRNGKGCYIITEPAGIVTIDPLAQHFNYHALAQAKSTLNLAEFSVTGGALDEASGLCYIVGGVCTKREDLFCKEYKQVLLIYDPATGNIIRETFLNEFYHIKCVQIYKGQVFLAGESIQTRAAKVVKKPARLINQDWMVSTYTLQGDHLSQFNLDVEDTEMVYDLSVWKDKIYVVGECYDELAINFKSLYAAFDLKGKLLDQQLFFSDPTLNRENRFTKIYHTADDKTLLLGKGKGWRIILLK
ncbi:hypothetical protein DBR32_14685 [Taibaiella sp. KBW10]|uniref:hypothetical protein n=1 Tax=Taibaiella sp. KBW10 TaxID=2153357 RepID=UPI000F594470|nr:hypothetical protein [Taibaiella sp. KBW10]RQO29827.1 hypothetical protein DBR32_14685 [Taibaiella sp. KBW10]